MEGRYKVPDASGWAFGHFMATGVSYVSLNDITKQLRYSITKLNTVIIKKKY